MNADKNTSTGTRACLAAMLCLGPLCTRAPGQQIDPATYQQVVDENLDLRQEQARLVRESADLRRKNADLILDVQALETKRDQMAALVSQLRTPDETKRELERLQAERSALVLEIQRLRQAPSVAGPVSTNPLVQLPGPEQGSSLFRKVEQENAELRQQLEREREAVQTVTKAREALADELSQQRAELGRLTAELTKAATKVSQGKAAEAAMQRALDRIARKSFQQQEEIDRLSRESDDLKRESRKREAAESQVRKEIKESPHQVDSPPGADILGAARQALRAGKVKDAEKLYLQVLRTNPKDPRIHYNLGVLYSDYLKDPGKAVYHFRKYLGMNPAAADADTVRSWLVELEVRAGM